jgi:hypothetical protein
MEKQSEYGVTTTTTAWRQLLTYPHRFQKEKVTQACSRKFQLKTHPERVYENGTPRSTRGSALELRTHQVLAIEELDQEFRRNHGI